MSGAPLSARAFAARCGVVPETVREWVRQGKLVPVGRTPGGHLRFSEDQVSAFLAGGGPVLSERAKDIQAHVMAARARLRMLRRAL